MEEPRGPSQLIEVPVTTNGQGKVKFPDIAQLRNTTDERIIIKGLRLITPEVAVAGVTAVGVNAPLTELQKIYLTIYCEGWEKAQNIPILTLNDMTSPGSTFPHRYQPTRFDDWEKVDWTKSFLQWANGTQSANAPYVVIFDALYLRLNPNGTEKVNL